MPIRIPPTIIGRTTIREDTGQVTRQATTETPSPQKIPQTRTQQLQQTGLTAQALDVQTAHFKYIDGLYPGEIPQDADPLFYIAKPAGEWGAEVADRLWQFNRSIIMGFTRRFEDKVYGIQYIYVPTYAPMVRIYDGTAWTPDMLDSKWNQLVIEKANDPSSPADADYMARNIDVRYVHASNTGDVRAVDATLGSDGSLVVNTNNRSGGTYISGILVKVSPTFDDGTTWMTTVTDIPYGVVFDKSDGSSMGDGQSIWVTISGKANILVENGVSVSRGAPLYISAADFGRVTPVQPVGSRLVGVALSNVTGGTDQKVLTLLK